MAIDAKLFAGSAVTSGAGKRIETRLHAVLTSAARRVQPAGRMRALAPGARGETLRGVTIGAGSLAVAGRTECGLGARLESVPRAKTGAVESRKAHFVEHEPPRKRGDRDAVATRAGAFGVARRAEIARTRGADAVFT